MAEGSEQPQQERPQQKRPQQQQQQSQQPKPKQEVSPLTKALHYQVKFFAYWFGSSRFDKHGAGGFEAENTKAYLADQALWWKSKNTVWKGNGLASKDAARTSLASTSLAEKGEIWTGEDVEPTQEPTTEIDPTEIDQEGTFPKYRRWYITIYSVFVLACWLAGAIYESVEYGEADVWQQKGGLETIWGRNATLELWRECKDYRSNYWQYWTYQFTHFGAMQVLLNCTLNLFFGTLIEKTYGWMITAFVFQMGVIFGSLFWATFDLHTVGYGCGGGSYAMIGMHIADLSLNTCRKQYLVMSYVVIAAMVVLDMLVGHVALGDDAFTMAPQVGGAIIGVLFGSVFVLNDIVKSKVVRAQTDESNESGALQESVQTKKCLERCNPWCLRIMQLFCVIIAAMLIADCIGFIAAQEEEGPKNALEDVPWCWMGQIWNKAIDENNWLCVRCHSTECISKWRGYGSWTGETKSAKLVSMNYCSEVGFYYDEGTQRRWVSGSR
mmetsp:Transcript_18302/g.52879  ORF Transcript_18302/g.52879 Transcript_18302/m.52879 type:complete len:496 (+) Transcript_18302:66-1553(+)